MKRRHSQLIQGVYAIRPFWGWKRALEDAGLSYDQINTELLDYVECKICGRDYGALDVHLMRKHDTTADDYREEYPRAQTTAETIRAALARRKEQKKPPLPRWEEIWTPEYALDRLAEMRRRSLPLNLYWTSNHDPALWSKVFQYFGSWDEGLRRIGLNPEEIRLARPTEHLQKAEVLARLENISRKQTNTPRGKDNAALANAARKYFGSWNKAIRAVGMEPAKETSRWVDASKAMIVKEIRRRRRAEESLRSAPERGEKSGRALRMRVEKLFGRWNQALRAAGMEPTKEDSPWRRAGRREILAEIRRRKRAGESLATRKIERTKWGTPLINRAKALFGSWAGGLMAANVPLPDGLMSPWPNADAPAIVREIRRRKRAGETLLISQIEKERWGTPLALRARNLFGSWSAALLAAGCEKEASASLASPWPAADKAAILSEIRRRRKTGENLRCSAVERERWGRPLVRRATELFGNWSEALRAAGIEPVKANSPWPRADETAVLAEIRRRHRAGLTLSSKEIQEERWGKPLVRRGTTLFGTWNNAILAAGLKRAELPERRRWSTADKASVLGELRRWKRTGQSLRTADIGATAGAAPVLRRAQKLFGSWRNALDAGGIKPAPRK